MKILIFNTLYSPYQIGGAEKSVQILAEGLLERGIEPVVVCTADRDNIDYVNGVKVYYVNTNNLYWSYKASSSNKYLKPLWHVIDAINIFTYAKLHEIFVNESPDVVHTNNLSGFSDIVWYIAKKRKLKIVHTLRDYYQLCPKSTMFKNGKNCTSQCTSCKIYSIPKKHLSKNVDYVVGISKFILNKHTDTFSYFQNAKQSMIYNPVHKPTNFLPSKKPDEPFITIGFVGSLTPSKGIEFILSRFSQMNLDRFGNVRLFVFGKAPIKEYGEFLTSKFTDKRIHFKGHQKPDEIYRLLDLLIVPSLWHEPFGRIVPEANSFAVPVLVSSNGGLPELVDINRNGSVYESEIDGDFELKLTEILANINNFNLDNLNTFSIEKHIESYVEIYTQLSQK